MELLESTYPAFRRSYFNLRKIIDYGKTTLALQLFAKDASSGEGLPKVKLDIEPVMIDGKAAVGSDLAKNVKVTSKDGSCNVKPMPDGKYMVTARRPGYADVVTYFTIVGGIMTKEVIEMVKE